MGKKHFSSKRCVSIHPYWEIEITLTTIKNKSSKKPFDLSLAAIDQEKKQQVSKENK